MSEVLDREPYFENLQEYQFQLQLVKVFNLIHLQAYNVDKFLAEQEVLDSEEEIFYCEGEQFSFIAYPV